ncbi:hypothetical protein CRUP_017906 [Coryphaenoides rupestris]|nr:hypothetical protein CRUP_017906 [Coryphaenoides rupestris]
MADTKGMFDFAIDRGGTFTDVFARLADGRERVLKLLSRDPQNYKDAPTEGIRRLDINTVAAGGGSRLFFSPFKFAGI